MFDLIKVKKAVKTFIHLGDGPEEFLLNLFIHFMS